MTYHSNKTKYLRKIADSIQMSFDIPEIDKEKANDAKIRFEAVLKRLHDSIEHLDIIYDPFKRHEVVSTKSLINRRGLLNRYKQKVKNNFNILKTVALLAIRKLNNFATGDADIQEVINSFVDSVEDVEKLVNEFLHLMGDYESKTFKKDILSIIDAIRGQANKLELLINDRVIEYIDTHLLSNNWMNAKTDELNLNIRKTQPLITELFDERQRALRPGSFPTTTKQQQSLNVSDANKMHYPDYIRTMNI